MQKARSVQQPFGDQTIEISTFSRRAIDVVDADHLGYWSKEEILAFLGELLESERVGVEAFATIGRAADLCVAEVIFESELAQGAICVLLRKEIATRGGARSLRHAKPSASRNSGCSLRRLIGLASLHQARSANMIEEAILNIFDSKLNAKLMYLLLLHRKQVEYLKTLLTY